MARDGKACSMPRRVGYLFWDEWVFLTCQANWCTVIVWNYHHWPNCHVSNHLHRDDIATVSHPRNVIYIQTLTFVSHYNKSWVSGAHLRKILTVHSRFPSDLGAWGWIISAIRVRHAHNLREHWVNVKCLSLRPEYYLQSSFLLDLRITAVHFNPRSSKLGLSPSNCASSAFSDFTITRYDTSETYGTWYKYKEIDMVSSRNNQLHHTTKPCNKERWARSRSNKRSCLLHWPKYSARWSRWQQG